MRLSQFTRAVDEEFGELGGVLVADLSLSSLDGRTAREALDAGESARDVWLALCEANDVSLSRRHGAGMRVAGEAR